MEKFTDAIFNALPGAAAVVDQNGEILVTNRKWEAGLYTHGYSETPVTGGNYFTICQKAVEKGDDYALKIIIGLRELFEGERENFELTMPCPEIDAQRVKEWCKVTISRLESDDSKALIFFEDVTKNMAVVRALRESEERYSQQFRHSLAGILISSPDGRIFDVNPAACRIVGYSREEIIKGGRTLLLNPEHPKNKKAIKFRGEKSVFEGEMVFLHKTGKEIHVELSSVVYKNEEGELRSLNTFRDISDQKDTLLKLKQEKVFTEAIINSIPGTFYVINREMNLVRYNDVFTEELGYSKEEIEGSDALIYFPEEEHEKVRNSFSEAFETGSTHIVAKVISKSGGEKVYHLTANKFEIGGEDYLVGAGTDVTDMMMIEKEKDRNYEMLSQLFESSPLAMAMFSPDDKTIKINNSFTELYGFTKLEAVGENVHELLVRDGQLDSAEGISDHVFSGQTYTEEVTRITKSGDELSILMNAIPIIHDHKVVAAYVIYVNLTDQKQLEKDLQKSLGEKEVLLQEVHHRVKNNLAIMAGLIDLQIMEEPDPNVEMKLNDIRSRIFSIAKIHENLYSSENMVSIRFDEYLRTVMEALPQKGITESDELEVSLDTIGLQMNLNQAVPFGLAVNEMMNILFSEKLKGNNLLLKLDRKDEMIRLIFEGDALNTKLFDRNGQSESFPSLLISIFLSQIKGEMKIENNQQNRLTLEFEQKDVKGSSSSLTSTQSSLLN
ncbi:PAS domain-containing sensor histidine kinase [Rhodohalobacter halophilus]|uniref:PAS domain-containing sensor histidine kinase n=1 Tax=Rhodohalobacter halophilus TaxID=1812810 RepID=UPI00083F524C|nr:PAS domain S-box protein [Rhodohalobacter halophilus]